MVLVPSLRFRRLTACGAGGLLLGRRATPAIIAAAGSGSLASHFAGSAPPETALKLPLGCARWRIGQFAEPEVNGSIREQMPMARLTHVDENLADARARIQDEITLAVTSWTNRSETARRASPRPLLFASCDFQRSRARTRMWRRVSYCQRSTPHSRGHIHQAPNSPTCRAPRRV